MKLDEFKIEMDRLSKRFDPKYYEPEVCMIIFRECESLDILWLRKTVTNFLGQHRPALIPEFREALRIEKDRVRINENKKLNSNYYEEPSMFNEEQKRFLWWVLKKSGSGEIKGPEVELICEELRKVIRLGSKQNEIHGLMKELSFPMGLS